VGGRGIARLPTVTRASALLLVAMLAGLAGVLAAGAAPSGPPVRVGSSLALTGPLAATGLVHKIVGEIYVEILNRKNGLLGRPVEWVLLDDQSKPDVARTLYERLVTVDKVDLLLGPYATANILSAMAVAQRYQRTLVHHTFGLPHLAKYEQQFPAWATGPEPGKTFSNLLLDALDATGRPPRTIAIVTSKFPSVHFLALGLREVAKKRGLKEVLFLEFDFGNRDFGPIAVRVKDASPDFLYMGAIGLEGNQLLDALKKLDYTPRLHFYTVPSPGPLAAAPEAKHALSGTMFEEHPPFTANPVAAEFVKAFHDRAARASLPYQNVDAQAAASFVAWQMIEAAVTATKSLDDKAIAQWLHANRVDTIVGKLRFDGPGNYGDDMTKLKQVQDGKWIVVWPKEWAAPGAKLIVP
jgi:ABC-type branched-subunit amino acid transport system substrate-binding protein